MGSRSSVHVTASESVYGGQSPNRYVPSVSVDLRVFYPPNLGHEGTAMRLLQESHLEAAEELLKRHKESYE